MPVQLKIQLVSLAEGKQLLREVQRRVVQQQATAFLAAHTACSTCGRQRSSKDHKTLGLRTLFGKLSLDSPRMRQCCRQADGRASISPLTRLVPERSTPELQYLETRWASLVSYGLTVRALQDFLPVDEELNGSLERDDVERLYATDPFLVHGIFVLERVAPWLVFVDRWCASA